MRNSFRKLNVSITPIILGAVLVGFTSQHASAQTSSSHFFKTDAKAEISLRTDRLDIELDNETGNRQAILSGNVLASQGPLLLQSEKAVIENQKGQVGNINVSGNVMIISENGQRANGDWAAYDIDQKTITMGDKVTLTQNGSRLEGRKLIIDTLTGIGTLTADPQQPDSRVRGVFTPGQK